MPGISCTVIPYLLCYLYGAMIILEKKILLNLIYLCHQKHNHLYIERNILNRSYNFILSQTFCIQILRTVSEMKHFINHWHYSYYLAVNIWMCIIWCINPCEQVCEIKPPNDTKIFHRLIQVWYAYSKFLSIIHIDLRNPCGK